MCHCDDNPPEFFECSTPLARKPHKCCECLREIQPGETYEAARGKWEGTFSAFATCEDCLDVRHVMQLDCWSYGWLIEDVRDALDHLEHEPCVKAFMERRNKNWKPLIPGDQPLTNQEFAQLSDAKKRVAIARDVLEQLNVGLVAECGTHIEIDGPSCQSLEVRYEKIYGERAKEVTPDCAACAKGAMLLARARVFDVPFTICDVQADDDAIVGELKSHFSELQLDLIEAAFECCIMDWHVDRHGPDDEFEESEFSDPDIQSAFDKAVAFGKKSSNPQLRMQSIMQNIIDHGGEFCP